MAQNIQLWRYLPVHTYRSLLLLATSVLACAGNTAFAAPDVLRDDPKRPVAEISRDLNVKPDQFRACFANVSPAAAGQRPEAERAQANKAVLLGCLQKANPKITNDMLDTVMDRYRPGGREAQMPLPKK